MPRYFFDVRGNGVLIPDKWGTELAGIEEAKVEVAMTLAEIARDVLPNSDRRELAVEVRDERSQPLLQTTLTFEMRMVQDNSQ
jgi:hypothetical protein